METFSRKIEEVIMKANFDAYQILGLHNDAFMACWYDYHRVMFYGLGPSDDYMSMYFSGGEL